MTEQTEVRRTKEAIKSVMKRKGYKYEDLAKTLGVTVTTVKRFLNKDDLSVHRLFTILEWLGLSLEQLGKLSEQYRKEQYERYSEEQEEFLVDHPDHHHILYELMDGLTAEQLQRKFNLSTKSIERYLMDLDHHNFIELHANNRVRLLNKGTIAFRDGGTLQIKTSTRRDKVFHEFFLEAATRRDDDPTYCREAVLQFLMRKETFEQLRIESRALLKKYHEVSIIEKALEPRENLLSVLYLSLVANVEARMKLFGMPKNFDA